ncbi:hypothetical protein Dimus_014728 [Dionaea muscipula]
MLTSSELLLLTHCAYTKPCNPHPTASLIPDHHLLCLRRRQSQGFANRRGTIDKIDIPARLRRSRIITANFGLNRSPEEEEQGNGSLRRILQVGLWAMEGVYILWLFLLPYAPGDPVWAISSETVSSLLGLSLNFFFVLPVANIVGIRVIDAPVLHPMSEGLFNFVIAWTLMFAPVLYTDYRRDRYKGSLDVLWGFQMFLTNTFLIPYMAIRLNEEADPEKLPPSKLGSLMINGAPVVGILGGAVSVVSILWGLFGRADHDNFGNISQRWEFLRNYLGSERLAYAFVWDIVLYTIFQPWLIMDNLHNVRKSRVNVVKYLGSVPLLGLVAYLLSLDNKIPEQ